jgi:hypothetical protein
METSNGYPILALRQHPLDWTRWRAQWQLAQAATFVLHLVGFSVLLRSIIRDTTAE